MHSEIRQNPDKPGRHLRVLVVEDNNALAENIAEFLDEQHYNLDFAADGLTALHLLSVNMYDVIVLDIMLPGISGIALCKRVREDLKCNTPILFMTAKDSIEDKEHGFLCGADDYLVKPFVMREFELRLLALARRASQKHDEICADKIRYDTGTFTVFLFDKQVELSGINIELFTELIRYYPRHVTHEVLSYAAWGVDDIDRHTIRTHIYTLRKLLQESLGYPLIKTLRSQGYRLISPDKE